MERKILFLKEPLDKKLSNGSWKLIKLLNLHKKRLKIKWLSAIIPASGE